MTRGKKRLDEELKEVEERRESFQLERVSIDHDLLH